MPAPGSPAGEQALPGTCGELRVPGEPAPPAWTAFQ